MVTVILMLLAVLGVIFTLFLIRDLIAHKRNLGSENTWVAGIIGIITDFLDSLGIGSFATTTLGFKITKFLKNDHLLPGTLNVGHSIPVIVQAFLFIKVVKVNSITFLSMVLAAMAGSWIGARTVTKFSEKKIQITMGIALAVTAVLMMLKQLNVLDILGQGNESTGLTGGLLIIAVVGNFILGGLMTVGVGLYAPCMAMVFMLGLNPLVTFPIMMASCSAIMPTASLEFIKQGKYSRKGVIGLTIGGIIGVILAVQFVQSVNLNILIWVIIAVVIYTAISMFLSGIRKEGETIAE
ncbi:anion permease [Paenibacillus larvae]|uniref:Anion permease n=6 Tax=Paenibacillus larvae TaxID=1464 RepID=A0A1V0UY50_9BACL|nr:anion permease [Paenibacillus larvae]AQR76786.1 anion permease [Paenibacillus larvae subsp. larvae]AQZ48596.1 anion permease [Paenibacillus larvae subsp. pulvifaciens]ARF70083.1 anion permease [Paenibacillus larvae subsp. pulvifaciens]AVF22326.1 putative membrane protein [Paenibacillus larvae subsp. larvae]AVF26667.1 putative membrane protein [Paenibacillus larvae subsp. larvae]